MKIQLTARFDSRDWEDLALMRLRRNGIEFSMAKVTVPRERQAAELPYGWGLEQYPFSLGAVNLDGLFFPLYSAQAVLSKGMPGNSGEAVLQIKVSVDQLQRAREILINAHARDISIK